MHASRAYRFVLFTPRCYNPHVHIFVTPIAVVAQHARLCLCTFRTVMDMLNCVCVRACVQAVDPTG